MRAKYILSEVMVGLWRNVTMTVAMIITMAVSLTMLGASLVLYQQIDDNYKGKDGIDEIVDQRRLLSKVFGVLGAAQNMSLVVAIIQGIAALLLVGNTIQVAAYSRRREVAVMKLVGASNWFIQSPFVLEAMFAGIIGALVAALALIGAKLWLIDGTLKPLTSLLTPVGWGRILWMTPILVGIGAVGSGVTGWVTRRFYIRK